MIIEALILFPHQLFEDNARLAGVAQVFLVEDALYFLQFRFHKQKLLLHRASMRMHAEFLRAAGAAVDYVEVGRAATMDQVLTPIATSHPVLHYIDPVDDWLERRLQRSAKRLGCELVRHDTQMFLTARSDLAPHFEGSGRAAMADFYKTQRKARGILIEDGAPTGGRWSFDVENRRRLPRGLALPALLRPADNAFVDEARGYVDRHFADNPGDGVDFRYPVTYADARAWLQDFLRERLASFGPYEDAMAAGHSVLFHSMLTPLLNIGLLTPHEVVGASLEFARTHDVPIASLEGFIRQIIGWREFVRGAYEFRGRTQRRGNFWGHERKLPGSFWNGTTGIPPIDIVIRRVLATGYAHHIERLMLLANFMQLCEFQPDAVYRWFMEMFVDAYDWVMVPNVYGMGLYADGGSIVTKPYLSSSNYVLKMSDFERGPWCDVWDGLFWRFIARQRSVFAANPRLNVMVRNLDRLDAVRRERLLAAAENYLSQLGS
jgi:deoxyribodipyrimidine photolyase-related protein